MRISDWSSDVCSSDPPAIFGGVLDQIAQHFIQVLPFHANYGCLVSVNVQSHIRIEPAYRPLHRDQARPDFGPALRRPTPPPRASAGGVMFTITPQGRGMRISCDCENGPTGVGGGRDK